MEMSRVCAWVHVCCFFPLPFLQCFCFFPPSLFHHKIPEISGAQQKGSGGSQMSSPGEIFFWGLRAHPNNPGWFHLEILNHTHKDTFSKQGHFHPFWGLGHKHTLYFFVGGHGFWGARFRNSVLRCLLDDVEAGSGILWRVQAKDINLGIISSQEEIKVTRWRLLGKPCVYKELSKEPGGEGDPVKEAEKEQGGKLHMCFAESCDAWGVLSFKMRIHLWVHHMVIAGQLWPALWVEWKIDWLPKKRRGEKVETGNVSNFFKLCCKKNGEMCEWELEEMVSPGNLQEMQC